MVQVRGQESAARLKTGALRPAYTEAIDAWAAGAGEDAVRRKLSVAVREKNRYFANRIAQTELARAHQAQKAAEFMADDTIEVVKVVINPMHPKRDICDLHARADLYGLGPGCYPKALAPRPPFHPHCWCKLSSRPSLTGTPWRQVPGGEAAYLRGLPLVEAAQVMGSQARAEAVLNGASVAGVLDAGKDPAYRLVRLGDGAGHPLVAANGLLGAQFPPVASAYEIAKAGGQHSGLIKRFSGEAERQIKKSLISLERRIAEHEGKMADPAPHVEPGTTDEAIRYLVSLYWPKEIETYRREADVLRGILQERKDGR